ncbi:MAG: hypothetical protein AB7G11_11040 [Phycisphaerales bacterium]
MRIDHVTLTGADDQTNARRLVNLLDHPNVEIGVLYSTRRLGSSRYPSSEWLRRFLVEPPPGSRLPTCRIAVHVCGSRNLEALSQGVELPPFYWISVSRVQFNGVKPRDYTPEFLAITQRHYPACIAQIDPGDAEPDVAFLTGYRSTLGFKRYPFNVLLDGSAGTGKTPERWILPPGLEDHRVGLAGGLRPENLTDELKRIEDVVGDRRIWIDLESGLRDERDRFSFARAERCLEIAEPWFTT